MGGILINTEVEIFLDEIDTDDLIDELRLRGVYLGESGKELINAIWMKRRLGNHNYQTELGQLIYQTLGHII